MNLRKPIQGRSGPSKQQFLHNDLLQWAWKLPQPAAFITHKLQQTAFCFIHFFHSLPLGANLRASSLPFSGRLEFLLTSSIHLVWAHRSRRFHTRDIISAFSICFGRGSHDFFTRVNPDQESVVIDLCMSPWIGLKQIDDTRYSRLPGVAAPQLV